MVIAQTICEHGGPLATDGWNFFSQNRGPEYREGHIWKWQTRLQFYVTAVEALMLCGSLSATGRIDSETVFASSLAGP